jgi:hypothetical protein
MMISVGAGCRDLRIYLARAQLRLDRLDTRRDDMFRNDISNNDKAVFEKALGCRQEFLRGSRRHEGHEDSVGFFVCFVSAW